MKKGLIVVSIFLIVISCSAQYGNVWLLGYGNSSIAKPAIDFSTGLADTFSFARPMQFFITNSSITHLNNSVKFYTNGLYIENPNGDTLSNSDNYNPGWLSSNGPSLGMGTSQGVLTLPIPLDSSKFIIFHESGEQFNYLLPGDTTPYPSLQPFHLSYSIVDTDLDNGNGGIMPAFKNIHCIEDTLFLGWITACKHGNGRDWWILVHKWFSNSFYTLLLSPQGLSSPQVQSIGPVMLPSDGLRDFDICGQAVFSPDGSKLAMAGQSNILHLFDFDRCTGLLSNYRNTNIDTLDRVRGCGFSPNSRFLYVSHFYNLYQYDTWQSNLDSAGVLVAQWDSFSIPHPAYFFMWQLAPDGKIYGNTFGSNPFLHVISSADSLGLQCGVLQHSFILTNQNTSLPNFPNYNLGPLNGSSCDSLTSINEEISTNSLQLKIYPNPTQHENISITYVLEPNKDGILEIFNITGNLNIYKSLPRWSTFQTIEVSSLSDGVYFLRLKSGDKMIVSKFVKID